MRLRSISALMALATAIAACTAGTTGGSLQDTDWVLRSYDDAGTLAIVPDGQFADASFATSRVRGFSGCNDFDAYFRATGPGLAIGGVSSSTALTCSADQTTFEERFKALLDSSRFYDIRRDTLTVYDGSRRTVLVFDAAPRNPVRGRWQVESFQSVGGTVAGVLPGTQIDVVFGLTNLSGNSGCNTFSGTYELNGTVLRVSRLATTQKACPQQVMDQETAFLKALQGAAVVEMRADRIVLTAIDGSVLVNMVNPEAAASPGPSTSAPPSTPPTATPAIAPTSTPTSPPAPTGAPTAGPASTPTAQPSAGGPTGAAPPIIVPSIGPSAPPAGPIPTVATCALVNAGGTAVATIAYPGSWHTVASPPELACRYFDPETITVPADPSTLATAVQASTSATAYTEAVAAATNPATWTVLQQGSSTVGGHSVTVVAATAKSDSAGVSAGATRFATIVDVGSAGTVTIWTTGTSLDQGLIERSALVSLMTALSTYQAGP